MRPLISRPGWPSRPGRPTNNTHGNIRRPGVREVDECLCEIVPSYCPVGINPSDGSSDGGFAMQSWCSTTTDAESCASICNAISPGTCTSCVTLGGMCTWFSWFGVDACSANNQPMSQTWAGCDFYTTGWNQYNPLAGGGVGEPTMHQLEMYCCYYDCFSFGMLGQQWCFDYYLDELGGNCWGW